MSGDSDKSRTGGSIQVTLARSYTGCKPSQRAALRALGLRKIRQFVVHEDTGAVRGLLHQVAHLIEVRHLD
jgi:large subunit ribosomal protein L30